MIDIPRCPEPAHPAYRNRWYAKFHQVLKLYHISSLYFLAGTIGTALFVQIGETLTKGGPGMSSNQLNRKTLSSDRAPILASLFIAFTLWCTVILAVNNCLGTKTRSQICLKAF